MKTFDDLIFKQHPAAKNINSEIYPNIYRQYQYSKHALLFFKNGYGVSVVFGSVFYSNGVDTYELAILEGDEKESKITYTTGIADDVIGYISKDVVTEVMKKVQLL